jgi:hypothetical protein
MMSLGRRWLGRGSVAAGCPIGRGSWRPMCRWRRTRRVSGCYCGTGPGRRRIASSRPRATTTTAGRGRQRHLHARLRAMPMCTARPATSSPRHSSSPVSSPAPTSIPSPAPHADRAPRSALRRQPEARRPHGLLQHVAAGTSGLTHLGAPAAAGRGHRHGRAGSAGGGDTRGRLPLALQGAEEVRDHRSLDFHGRVVSLAGELAQLRPRQLRSDRRRSASGGGLATVLLNRCRRHYPDAGPWRP